MSLSHTRTSPPTRIILHTTRKSKFYAKCKLCPSLFFFGFLFQAVYSVMHTLIPLWKVILIDFTEYQKSVKKQVETQSCIVSDMGEYSLSWPEKK